jgi:Fic family protein
MAHSLNTQTDREVRYEKRQHKKLINQQNMDRTMRLEKRNEPVSRQVAKDISDEVRKEISIVAQKRRDAPVRNSTRSTSTSFFL